MPFEPEITFSPEGDTRDRVPPSSLITAIAELGKGLARQGAKPIPLTLVGPGFSVSVDVWLLWEHLGDYATIQLAPAQDPSPFAVWSSQVVAYPGGTISSVNFGPSAYTFKVPDPVDMIENLEVGRRQWLDALRATPEKCRQMVQGSELVSIDVLVRSVRLSAYAFLTFIDIMLLYVRNRWHLLPQPPDGVVAGLAHEIELCSLHLPNRDARHPESQAVLDRFVTQLEDLLDRPLPQVGHSRGPVTRHGARARELFDAERLEWYLTLPTYVGIRALRRNRYNYVAVLFTDDRVVIDTTQKENRVFLWRGPLADVLAAVDAALTGSAVKRDMEGHALCVGAHEHDEAGSAELRRFLT